MTYPLPVRKYPVTQKYGVPSKRAAAGYHEGIDQGCPVGTPVRCAYPGRVIRRGRVWGSAYGDHSVLVRIKHEGKTYYVLYAHMSAWKVRIGQQVNAGDLIGLSGNEGNSTGPHLHLQVNTSIIWAPKRSVNPKFVVAYKPSTKAAA